MSEMNFKEMKREVLYSGTWLVMKTVHYLNSNNSSYVSKINHSLTSTTPKFSPAQSNRNELNFRCGNMLNEQQNVVNLMVN
jgi:hypothetical protein